MQREIKFPLFGLLALLLAAFVAVLVTHGWADELRRLRAMQVATPAASEAVDMRPLETAQQMAALAVTHSEQDYAKDALRAADRSVDLAFAMAIQDAIADPALQTEQIRAIKARLQTAQSAVAADQNRISQFTVALGKAGSSAKEGLQSLIAIAEAQLALDQDSLEDAQQDLLRSGGNRQAQIQQLLDQHRASDAQSVSFGSAANGSVELTRARNMVAQLRALFSLHSKDDLLIQAQREAQQQAAQITASHQKLEKQVDSGGSASAGAGAAPGSSAPNSAVSILRRLSEDKQRLATWDQLISEEQTLADTYGSWNGVVKMREKFFLHGILLSVFWIILIVVTSVGAGRLVDKLLQKVAFERRKLLMLRAIGLVLMQVLALLLILLVILGVPSNVATVVALAGAGLTVALKDFIVGFFGWFVLMGKDGIRPGDWVEINGVAGEVFEVGFLHTVLLETGNWTDSGHPTGRKVSFVNSFAIEGHYFNFSTSGQWMWDEIEVQARDSDDPYALGDDIRKIAADETAVNVKIAEEEWRRAALAQPGHSFSAAPAISVRPNGSGVAIVLRYITRANERHEVRARINRAVVELLRAKKIPESAASTPTVSSTTASG